LRFELDHYLKEDVMPDIAQFDILNFRKETVKVSKIKVDCKRYISNSAFNSRF